MKPSTPSYLPLQGSSTPNVILLPITFYSPETIHFPLRPTPIDLPSQQSHPDYKASAVARGEL